jgi:hypothetical protein
VAAERELRPCFRNFQNPFQGCQHVRKQVPERGAVALSCLAIYRNPIEKTVCSTRARRASWRRRAPLAVKEAVMFRSRLVLVAIVCAAMSIAGAPRAEARQVSEVSEARSWIADLEATVARWAGAWRLAPAAGAPAARPAAAHKASSPRMPRVPGGGHTLHGGFKRWPSAGILCTTTTEPNGQCG